jgi:hypothetical protein
MLRRPLLLAPLLTLLLLQISFSSPSAAEPENVLAVDLNDPAALQEATRILTEEIRLAARPQTYVIVDLVERSVIIKGRGAELHRFPIEHWSAVHLADASATFRLQARPPVARRKIEPSVGADQPPVSLEDMPNNFTLVFAPSLFLAVHPSASQNFWAWLRFTAREWWMWLKDWSRRLTTGNELVAYPVLRLTLSPSDAQSLAWTVTEDMRFLIRRTSSPAS